MKNRKWITVSVIALLVIGLLSITVYRVSAGRFLAVSDDPLVRMPGTQPDQGVSLESPNRCLNCHAGYNQAVEPGFNWMGSMMAQSARDPVFWATMTVAGQDSMWALGNPNAVDLCERCHFPKGWVEGRSDPPNASLMTGADYDGVQCDFCHQMVDPFFAATYDGTREGSDWVGYWDETNQSDTPSQPAADATFQEDAGVTALLTLFNGNPAYTSNQYTQPNYNEAGSGQFVLSPNGQKRASFADAAARHQMLYSRFHKSETFCGTCHDVSNPALHNLTSGQDGVTPGDGSTVLGSEADSAYSYYHVERTYSEFSLSKYGQQGGAAGIGPFAPDTFTTSLANNYIARCQDCHMRDVVGTGANKNGVPVRPDESVEHPQSGQPLHDLTGGNMWVPTILASTDSGSPNYDPYNESLLYQGADVLTLDLTQGQGLDPAALLAGADRARQQLLLAASINNLSYDPASGDLTFQVQNQTGHKLISGFPEGRRMFVNVRVYSGGSLVYEANPYDTAAGTLKGLDYPYDSTVLTAPAALSASESYVDELVYEMHPTSELTGETETFHFVLATGRYKDNRIPPAGFDISGASERMAEPVWHGASAPDLYTSSEYQGGYDEVAMTVPAGGDYVEVNLYYQTTSREFIAFLRDEINGTANQTLPGEAYIIQSDSFFSQLAAWGNTIWNLWVHNMNDPGAAPFLMTQSTWGEPATTCGAPTPTLLSASPDHQQVALEWSVGDTTDPNIVGYNVYYDQSGKAQLVASGVSTTTYTDSGLTNGQEYCYKVTSTYSDCESGFSNIICATPTNKSAIGMSVSSFDTGRYEGRGNNKTFTSTTSFTAGDEIILQVTVTDETGAVVPNASVEITISGPEVIVVSGSTDSNGFVELSWRTSSKGGNATTPGSYTATVTDVVNGNYTWDAVSPSIDLTVQ